MLEFDHSGIHFVGGRLDAELGQQRHQHVCPESRGEWEAEEEEEKEDVTEYVKGNARNLDKLHIGEDS